MRFVAALAAILLLAGCDGAGSGSPAPKGDSFDRIADAEAFASTGSGFDYRYAYRLPGNQLKAVIQSNADACDKIGPARCRILAMRYRVGDGNHIRAVLTIKLDPSIARAYGDAVTRSVASANGVLIDTEITGTDGTSPARSMALIDRLRDQLRGAEAQVNSGNDVETARARVERLKAALDTIAEVEAGQGQTLASAPMLLTYESSSAINGLGSADANFRNAGQTFQNSLAMFLVLLAQFGPWLLGAILLILVLRWLVHGRALPAGGDDAPNAVPVSDEDGRGDNRNLIQRWFARDDDEEQR